MPGGTDGEIGGRPKAIEHDYAHGANTPLGSFAGAVADALQFAYSALQRQVSGGG